MGMIPLKSSGKWSCGLEFTSPSPKVVGQFVKSCPWEDIEAKTLSGYFCPCWNNMKAKLCGTRNSPNSQKLSSDFLIWCDLLQVIVPEVGKTPGRELEELLGCTRFACQGTSLCDMWHMCFPLGHVRKFFWKDWLFPFDRGPTVGQAQEPYESSLESRAQRGWGKFSGHIAGRGRAEI